MTKRRQIFKDQIFQMREFAENSHFEISIVQNYSLMIREEIEFCSPADQYCLINPILLVSSWLLWWLDDTLEWLAIEFISKKNEC